MLAFFIMIFDSLRQTRAVIRNNYGISRFNTRINFYFYEITFLYQNQSRFWTIFRIIAFYKFKFNKQFFQNYEP